MFYAVYSFLHQFDSEAVEIEGKKMALRTDESYLYWTPAPPKWDAAPSNVKRTLFVKYDGAALAQDQDQPTVRSSHCQFVSRLQYFFSDVKRK